MAGITLAVAQQNLDDAIANLASARKASSRQIGDRARSSQQIDKLLAEVKFWDEKVSSLSMSSASGGRGRSRNASANW